MSTAATLGERLKAAREAKGLSAQKAADKMHLDGWVVEALERGDYLPLGPPVYVKGHLKRYVDLLGLPLAEMLEAYAANMPAASPAAAPPQPVLPIETAPAAGRPPVRASIAALAVMAVLAAGLYGWQTRQPRGAAPPPSAALEPEAASAPLTAEDEDGPPGAFPAAAQATSAASRTAAPTSSGASAPVAPASAATPPRSAALRLPAAATAAASSSVAPTAVAASRTAAPASSGAAAPAVPATAAASPSVSPPTAAGPRAAAAVSSGTSPPAVPATAAASPSGAPATAVASRAAAPASSGAPPIAVPAIAAASPSTVPASSAALRRAAPATTAAAASTAGAGRARLRLSFSADSWVEVHDATGKSLFAGKGRANSVKTIAGQAPMNVYLGFANGVQVQLNNRVVAIGPQFVAGDAARFEAGADGVLRRDAHDATASNAHPPHG